MGSPEGLIGNNSLSVVYQRLHGGVKYLRDCLFSADTVINREANAVTVGFFPPFLFRSALVFCWQLCLNSSVVSIHSFNRCFLAWPFFCWGVVHREKTRTVSKQTLQYCLSVEVVKDVSFSFWIGSTRTGTRYTNPFTHVRFCRCWWWYTRTTRPSRRYRHQRAPHDPGRTAATTTASKTGSSDEYHASREQWQQQQQDGG